MVGERHAFAGDRAGDSEGCRPRALASRRAEWRLRGQISLDRVPDRSVVVTGQHSDSLDFSFYV